MEKYTEIKAELNNFTSFLRDAIPESEFGDAPTLYYISAALKIWGSNVLYSPDYGTLLSCVADTSYTIEQVVTAMSCCSDTERKLMVPEFFERLVERDKQTGGNLAQACVEKLNALLVSTAMINGDFTVEEANCLSEILSGLSRYALAAGVTVDEPLDYHEKITEKNESSYLQNDALVKAARKHTTQKNDEPQEAPSGDVTIPVTIHVNLTASEGSTAQSVNTQAASPEEAPTMTQVPQGKDGETLESLLAELDDLVGLSGVKQDVHSLMNFIKVTKIREPFPIWRTRKSEKKLNDFLIIPMPVQAATEAQRRASKRSGGIHPRAECGRTVL